MRPCNLVDAGDNAPERESDGPASIDPLQPLLVDDMRPRPGPPRRLVEAISANILRCAAHCISPSYKPTNISIWSAYRGEFAAYTRYPACPYDARLVQLSTNSCVGFDAGAFFAPHPSDNAGKLACDIQSSAPTARCPALAVLTRDQGRNTTRRLPPVDGSALRDPSTASTARSTGVDVGGTHFAFNGRGARLPWRHDLFNHRRNPGVARRATRARQKEQRGFLMLSGR